MNAMSTWLERFRISCSKSIAAVPDVVGALVGGEEAEGDGDERADLLEGPWTCGAEERLQLGEGSSIGLKSGL